MSKTNDIPAFPCPVPHSDTGMTLRDYFAAKAMQSLIAIGASPIGDLKCQDGSKRSFPDQPYYFGYWENSDPDEGCGMLGIGIDAYQIADAMLQARNEKDEASK